MAAACLYVARLEWMWRLPVIAVLILAGVRSMLYLAIWRGGFPFVVVIPWMVPAHIHAALIVTALIPLTAAVVSDLVHRRRRDWAHATGVAVWFGMASLALGEYVKFWLRW